MSEQAVDEFDGNDPKDTYLHDELNVPWGGDQELRRSLMAERFGSSRTLASERVKTPAEKLREERRKPRSEAVSERTFGYPEGANETAPDGVGAPSVEGLIDCKGVD